MLGVLKGYQFNGPGSNALKELAVRGKKKKMFADNDTD